MVSRKTLKKLQTQRPKGLSRLLLLARRNFVVELGTLIEKSGLPPMPDSCAMLLPHIDLEGTRSTDIANRAGLSKQAVTQMISHMEALQLVEKMVDPTDARATLISFTDFGTAYLIHMHAIIDQVEDDIRSRVGDERMAELRALLDFMAYEWPSQTGNKAGT